ncbi:MAG TPA: Holliday junction resolvase RuvX [Candidatus Limnocylindrales bacterium]|nr:Holliday junction resolvase RuvX [Candidatus Limnocylindrales bacterium]
MSRLVALDHGTRRIGVAVGDTETAMAFVRPAIQRRSLAIDVDTISMIVRDEEAQMVLLGLPFNMDGSEGPQASAVRDFGRRLEAAGLKVAYADERLTSWQAAELMADEGRRARRRSGELDSAAARLILQEYLDALPASNLSSEPE